MPQSSGTLPTYLRYVKVRYLPNVKGNLNCHPILLLLDTNGDFIRLYLPALNPFILLTCIPFDLILLVDRIAGRLAPNDTFCTTPIPPK